MCGRYTLRQPTKIKIQGLNARDLSEAKPRFNVAPSQKVLTVIESSNERHALFLNWGLTPSWSKEPKRIKNARAETLAEKPSFRDSFKRRRCLIPADGFFEWLEEGEINQPIYFQMKDESVFSFAGIWDAWKNAGREIHTCAIITTTPNDLVSPVHDRMPVILHPSDYDLWLGNEVETDSLKKLLAPFPAEYMRSYAVSTSVNSSSVDAPQLVEKLP